MAPEVTNSNLPELRELVKDNSETLYRFVEYLVEEPEAIETIVLKTLSQYGKAYRRLQPKRQSKLQASDLRLRLYRMAWERVESSETFSIERVGGRDMRQLSKSSEDLLGRESKTKSPETLSAKVLERVRSLDLEYRAPLVLRDLLHFTDDEAARILKLRWGVYRHRLNRARLDLKDCLRGRYTSARPIRPSSELTV